MIHLGTINEDAEESENEEKSNHDNSIEMDEAAERRKKDLQSKMLTHGQVKEAKKKQAKNAMGIQALASYFGETMPQKKQDSMEASESDSDEEEARS